MPVTYLSTEDAIARPGLRMVVVGGVPSPWGEAAKGILHIKGLSWVGVRLAYDDDAQRQWAGQRSGPIAIYDNEPPRAGWAEILLLAERLAPAPSLLPADAAERATMFGLAHEICGQEGLGWTRRLQLIHAGAFGSRGRPVSRAQVRLQPAAGGAAAARGSRRCCACWRRGWRLQLARAAPTISAQRRRRSTSTARPSWACSARCRRSTARWTRRGAAPSTCRDPETDAALDPILLEHRDMMYARHLELPLSL